MPMYEYRCAECGRENEQLRRMSEADTNVECPHCGSKQVTRLFSTCCVGGGAASGGSGGNGGGGGCAPRGGFS
ncbi:MAG TPA: zinc ribbon domain-containing protein [Paludibaculum sp.]